MQRYIKNKDPIGSEQDQRPPVILPSFKYLLTCQNAFRISGALQKFMTSIEMKWAKDAMKKEEAKKELGFLKSLCLSENVLLSELSCQALYELIPKRVLNVTEALAIFNGMLPSVKEPAPIAEGIIRILELALDWEVRDIKPREYKCPYDVKGATQHPIITLLKNKNINIVVLGNQLAGICNHSNENIRTNCLEFLRPVFLYAFYDPEPISDLTAIWNILMRQQTNSKKLYELLYEIFRWGRVTPKKFPILMQQLLDSIEYFRHAKQQKCVTDMLLYLIALLPTMLEYSYDPRNAFKMIISLIEKNDGSVEQRFLDYLLLSMSQVFHSIPLFYMEDAIAILKILIQPNSTGNSIIHYMVLDSLLVGYAGNSKLLRSNVFEDIKKLVQTISKRSIGKTKAARNSLVEGVVIFQPNILVNLNAVQFLTDVCESENVDDMLEATITKINTSDAFATEMQYIIRALLLCSSQLGLSFANWEILFHRLVAIARADDNVSANGIYLVLDCLATEKHKIKQLQLLRGLSTFASLKENTPLVLGVYSPFTELLSSRVTAIDLFTRLWKAQERAYAKLYELLIKTDESTLPQNDQMEINIAKANVIKDICETKAALHGKDLVQPLSNIINKSANNDLACALALDCITLLCKGKVMSMPSTWNILRPAFQRGLGSRTKQSLCRFFGEVPLIKLVTDEDVSLYKEALKRLWQFLIEETEETVVEAALHGLRDFNFTELQLGDIPIQLHNDSFMPRQYRNEVAASQKASVDGAKVLTYADVVPYIPGECWIELLKLLDHACVGAVQFVRYLIEIEMSTFRGGVYMGVEGRAEPIKLLHVSVRSPLAAILRHIREKSVIGDETFTVLQSLKCIAHEFNKPIPPFDWSFLLEYINNNEKFVDATPTERFDMQKYALTIAANRIAHSRSAKTLIENYLDAFDVEAKPFEEHQIIFELIPAICDGIAVNILKKCLWRTLHLWFNVSSNSNFEENCYFERAIAAIVKLFDRPIVIAVNVDAVAEELIWFCKELDVNHQFFKRYAGYLINMPSDKIDLIKPSDEISYYKCLIIRAEAASLKKPFVSSSNSLMWLNQSIADSFDTEEPNFEENVVHKRKAILFETVADVLTKWTDDKTLCEWIQFYMGIVQFNFKDTKTKSSFYFCTFTLDLLMYSMYIAAGGWSMFRTIDLSDRLQWIRRFPETLWTLSKRSDGWANAMPRIYEFLYHLNTQQRKLPKEYVTTIGKALICVRDNEHFLNSSNWIKFISLKS